MAHPGDGRWDPRLPHPDLPPHRPPTRAAAPSILARTRSKLLGANARQRLVRAIYGLFARFVGPKKGRILFASDQQPTMEGHLLRVHQRMIERGLDERFDLRSSFRLPCTTGWGTTARILYLLATSSYHTASYDYDLIDLDALYDACPPDTVVLFRMHHFVKESIEIPEKYRDRFFDFTRFPDGLGLLHVTDLLITDYSSIIYEFALLDRPMLFVAPDRAVYAATRGFHRDDEETAPGRVCETFDEVVRAIREGDFQQEKPARFRAENFDRIDTGAADRVIDWLILEDRPALEAEQR